MWGNAGDRGERRGILGVNQIATPDPHGYDMMFTFFITEEGQGCFTQVASRVASLCASGLASQ